MSVEFFRHSLQQEDIDEVEGVLRSLFLTTGPVVQTFEEQFAAYTGNSYVVGVTSCTAALHLALLAHNIGPGDEVITTPLTFAATALAIMHTGASPVFVDVEPESGLIDVDAIEAAVTKKTKAILPVHLYGAMVDMRRLRELADAHGLLIIEDAAHCIEGERDGVRPGDLGDAVCYSFYATKNLTSGEGGALGTKDPVIAEKARQLRLHGMTADAAARHSGSFRHYDVTEEGWKYNMDSIHAALLVNQLSRLAGQWEERRALVQQYDALLDIRRPSRPGKSAYHLYTIWVENRDECAHALREQGVGVAINYRALHTLSLFKRRMQHDALDFPHAYRIGHQTLSLPLYPGLQPEEIETVVQAVYQVCRNAV